MAEGDTFVDVPDDIFGHIEEEDMQAHSNLMTETVANGQHVHNIARSVGVKKFNELDALQSAAAEVILKIKP